VAISVIQATYFDSAASGIFGDNVAPGNSVILIPGLYTSFTSGTFSTSNPQFGGSSVPGTKLVDGTGVYGGMGFGYTAIWLLSALVGGAASVGLDFSTPPDGGPVGMFAYEVTGLGAAPQLDPAGGVTSATGTGTDVDSGPTPAITQDPEIIFGYGHDYHVTLSDLPPEWTAQSGGLVQNLWGGYQIVTSAGDSYDWTQTAATDGTWGAAVVAICAQPTPPPPGPGLLLASFP
jgi:hypothetical protein